MAHSGYKEGRTRTGQARCQETGMKVTAMVLVAHNEMLTQAHINIMDL